MLPINSNTSHLRQLDKQSRKTIREAARLKIEAGIRAVQPAIDKKRTSNHIRKKVMIPVYQDIAKRSGIRVDGDEDEPVSKEPENEQLGG